MTDTLKAIPGVGPARANKLSKAGYSIKQLARAKPATVAKKANIPEKIAEKAVSAAKKAPAPKKAPKKTSSKKVAKKKTSKKSTPKKAAKKVVKKKATAKKVAKKSAPKKAPKKTSTKKAPKKKASPQSVHPSGKNTDERVHLLEKTISELTNTVHKLESRIKRQQQDLQDAQHQLEYLSWDALPRVVHELAWYIRTHLDSWSEEKIFDWLKDHGHEERHIRHALSIARGA